MRSIATKALADTFAGSGSGYGSDEDPELVKGAVPFALKTMEQVLAEQPRHLGLLTALAGGFTQYGYAFVQQDADMLEERDAALGREEQARARKLYLRAREYGLRGLELRHPGLRAALLGGNVDGRNAALGACTKEDVALMYWTGAPWTLAIAADKNDMNMVGQLPAVEALMLRALAIDEAWGAGSLHEFFVAYDGSRSEAEGGGPAKAKAHLERALALAQNKRLGVIVSYAEAVTVGAQDRKEFTRLLEQVTAADIDKAPEERLANLVAQRRARWLLARTGELFAE